MKRDGTIQALRATARAWKLLAKKQRGLFPALGLRAVVTSLSPYVTIYGSARIIGELAGARRPETLAFWVVLTLGLTAGLAALGALCKRWAEVELKQCSYTEGELLTEKLFSLDYNEVDRQDVFDLDSQLDQAYTWRGWGIAKTVTYFRSLLEAIVRILGGAGLSVSLFAAQTAPGSPFPFLNHPLCAAAIVAVLLAVAAISPLCANRANGYLLRTAEENMFVNRCFSYFVSALLDRRRAADVRLYRQLEGVCEPNMSAAFGLFSKNSKIDRWMKGPVGLWRALSQSLSAVLTAVIYLFVCLKAWCGAFGVGEVTQYVGAITQTFGGLSSLLTTLGDMRANASYLETDFRLLDWPNHLYRGSLTTEKRADRQYSVEFKDVSFRYPGSDRWALRHVNLTFRVGKRLAVVGKNGSGKTTFIKLLCRLYDPTEGEILLNGIDIRKYRPEEYRALFSVVFQDFKLFSLPLGENVAGSREPDRRRAEACLRAAGLDPAAFQNGLDTFLYRDLNDKGVEVSGGEAQKIAIARALYRDAPFLVLDEPTAALDPIAEAEIYEKFDGIAGDKTAIYISHRLSSCKFCDTIAVFDEGQIVQRGSHEELVQEPGVYATLWNAQAHYYTK